MRNFLKLGSAAIALLLLQPMPVHAENTALDNWHVEVNRTRGLAENDIPRAYKEALRLQDSMPATATPADRTRILNLLARIELYLGETEATEKYAKEAFALAQKDNDRAGQAEADLNIALNTVNQSRFDAMSEAIKHSMSILDRVNRPELLAEAMLRTSMMFRRFDRMDDSVEMAVRAMDMAKRSSSPVVRVYAYQGMAIAYDQSEHKAEARDYYTKMRAAAQEAHSRLMEGDALLGLGSVLETGDIVSGEHLIREAIVRYRKAGGPFYLAHAQHLLANNLLKQGRVAEAQATLGEVVRIYEEKSNKVGLWWALRLRGTIYERQGKVAGGKANAERIYRLGREIGHPFYVAISARTLAASVAAAGDFKRAYGLNAEADEMAEKNARQTASARMLDLAKRYEDESQRRQVEELTRNKEQQKQRQRWLLTVLGGSVALLAVAVLFLLHLRRSREEVRQLNIGLEQRVQERTAELHQSRQSLAEAQRIAHVGSWDLAHAANRLEWSEEVFRIFGIDPQSFGYTYQDFLEAVHPDDRKAVADAFAASLEKKEPYEIEHRVLLPDGRIKYVHERSETFFDTDDKPVHSIGTVQDITERKLAEMALHENLEQITLLNRDLEESAHTMGEQATELEASREQLKDALEFSEGIINAIPDILFEMDRNGRYLNVWTRTPELLAVQRAMLLGKTANELLSPENAAAAMEGIREADEKGVAVCKDMCFELPDGKHWFAHTLAKKPGSSNAEATFIALSRDITERKHMEEALAASERNFRSMTENLPDNIARWDTQGRYLYVNPTHAHTLGVVASDIVGTERPAAHDRVREAIAQVVATGQAIALVRQPVLVDGEMQIHEVSLAPEYDTEGRIVSVVGLGRNMTEMYRMQDVIAAREHELRSLAESSPGMMGAFYLRPDGTVCMPYVSSSIYELFGLHPQDVAEDASSLMKLNHPDDAQRVMDSIAESARTMTPWHCEYRIQHPTKGERWMEGSTNPQPHPDGGTIWYGYVHDITERKRAEHAHEETRRRLQSVLKTIPDLVWMKDVNGVYLSCNHEFERFFGAKEAEIVGKTDYDFVDAELADFFRQKDREAIAAERICINEEWVTFADDGRRVLLEARKVPVYDEDGKVAGVLGVSRDITERKRMEAALKESEARYHYNSSLLQAIIESPSSSVSIYALDREYRFLAFNSRFREAAKRLWHADIELGMSMLDAIDNEAHREFSRHGFDHVLAGNHGFLESKEERIEDGKPVCEYHDNYGSPIYSDNGEVIGMTVFVLNTTERKLVEQKLKEALEFSEGIINAMPDLLFEVDAQGRYLNVWTHTPELLAAQKEVLLGKTVSDVLPPESAATCLEALREAGEHDVSVGKIIRIDLPQGESWFEISVSKKPGGSSMATTFLVLSRDITERKRMEEKLAVREQEFRALAENSPDTIARYIHGGIRTYINPLFAKLAGKPAHEMLGVTAADYQAVPQARAYHNALLHSLESGEEGECEYTWPAHDGRLITSHIRIVPEFGADGKVASVLAVGRDITERKRMEAALKESEARYRYHFNQLQSMLESASSVSVFALDREYRYLFFNKRHKEGAKRIRGTDIEIGMNMIESIPDEAFREYCRQGFDRVLAGNSVFVESKEKVDKDGALAYEYNDNFGSPIFNDEGEVIGLTVFSINTTERKQIEKALQRSEQLMRTVIDATPDWIFIKDREHRYQLANKGYANALHIAPEDFIGKNDLDLGFPEELVKGNPEKDIRGFWADDCLVLDSNETHVYSDDPATIDGKVHTFHTIKVPLRDADGKAYAILAFARDITERKQLEAALNESEARYRKNYNLLRSIFESISSVSIYALDQEYRYLAFNRQHREGAKRLWGSDITVGMCMLEAISDGALREVCRQGFDRVLAGHSLMVETKQPGEKGSGIAYEFHENYASPIFDDEGDAVGLTVFVINVTKRKQLEADLMASRNFLNSVLDSVSDPIFVKDRQHRWTLLNDAFCAFIGHPREALTGKSDYDFLPKAQADVFWEKDEFVFESGEINLNEENFTTASGEEHFIQTKKTPFVSGDGRQMLVGVIRDITERRHLEAAREAALAEAQRLADTRSQFIAHMSHELRTPLNGILGYAQMLGRDGKLSEKQLASVEVIRHSGEHLLSLIEDILDIARIESGRLELDIVDIPLAQFLNVVRGIVEVKARQKQLGFRCELAPDLPQGIRGDEKRLRQVLLNLLSNAVKYTDQGEVTLSVSRVTPSRLAFAVADTGVGITAAGREKIFQPFEQVGEARRRAGGTGLGLAISRQLVRLMGGDITLESGPDSGSTFRFELELPEAGIKSALGRAIATDEQPAKPEKNIELSEPLLAPPPETMQELHRLALQGNMRDIVGYAEKISGLDPRYGPFAAHLKRLAEGYQSRAILAFVEEYLS